MTKRKDELSVVSFDKNGYETPAGVIRKEYVSDAKDGYVRYFYPLVTDPAYNNLYGRMMALLEATCDKDKLKVVKTLFQRELNDWFSDLEKSVKELNDDHTEGHGYYYRNIYVYGKMTGRAIRGDHPDLNEIDI